MCAEVLVNDVIEKKESQPESMKTAKKISVVASVNNFEASINDLYHSLSDTMLKSGREFEIIFVDDGSVDKTYEQLLKIRSKDERVKIIKMRALFGEAASLDAGIKQANGMIIIYIAGRVRVDTSGLLDLLDTLEQGQDMVIGWRYPRADSFLNQIVSKVFNRIACKFSGSNLHDMNSGVMVAKREVLENVPIYGALNQFLPVMAARQGYKVTETKIKQLKGHFRTSRYFKEYLQRLLDLLSVIFLTKYSKKPIHFLGFVGTLFTIIGLGLNVYLLIYRLLQMGPIGGRPLLLVGALFLVVGIQMISIGLIGEMIIFTHAREIKEYNIEKTIE